MQYTNGQNLRKKPIYSYCTYFSYTDLYPTKIIVYFDNNVTKTIIKD